MVTAQPGGGALDPQGPVSEAMANLFWLMLGLGGAVFVAVVVVLGLGLFRRRPVGEPQPDRQGRDSFGRWFVVGGVVVPLVILLIVFGATVRAMRFVPTTAPPEALVIEVVGHQFWWEVRYPTHGVTVRDELHLPVGRRVNLQLTSADVITASGSRCWPASSTCCPPAPTPWSWRPTSRASTPAAAPSSAAWSTPGWC